MSQHKVLVLSSSANSLIRSIEGALGSNNNFSFATKGNIKDFDITLLQHKYYLENNDLYFDLKDIRNPNVAILANFTDNSILKNILSELNPYHLIGLTDMNAISDIRDFLLTTSQNLEWRPSALISPPIKETNLHIIDSQNYHNKILEMVEGFNLSETFSDFSTYIKQVINELLSNALYNAPVDATGNHIYKDKSRAEKISMIPGKEVELQTLENDKKIVISIKDHYGSITKQDIDAHILNSKVLKKSGGAGVGLYTAFRYCHKLIINVKRGKSSEVIVIFNKLKRNKQYLLIDKSFHFFNLEGE